ncbi:MAG: hypothetical protein FJW69_01085 [Actinobacteria bacterium]|nr:hypothetical protein [Actinomycetota bacterium]MBM3712588.1 hypothetical protein [Actinomycetota bacterium]
MNTRLAEEEIFTKKAYPLLYLVKGDENVNNKRIIQSRTGIFYVLVVIVIFFCMGILLNIGLKIQSVNYERKILEINEMLSLEKERADRLDLKISELKSPARVVETAQKDLKMEISPSVKVMKVSGSVLASEEKIHEYVVKNTVSDVKKYDTFLSTIYSIKDIVMVVSEGVLTFFIP